MGRMPYSLSSYKRNLLKHSLSQSKERMRLLVEGPEDRRLFTQLIDAIAQTKDDPEKFKNSISIDISEQISSLNISENKRGQFHKGLGAREKIEIVCKAVEKEKYADRLVGFVDREFDGFELIGTVKDNIQTHQIENRLILSRGHSIENYFFNKTTTRRLINQFLNEDWFEDVQKKVDATFDSAILHACAISLAVKELAHEEQIRKFTKKVDKTLDHVILDVSGSELEVKYDLWKKIIEKKISKDVAEPEDIAEKLICRIQEWVRKLQSTDVNIHRWLCRGHTGLEFIGAFLRSCTKEMDPHSKPPKIRLGDFFDNEDRLFLFCADIWIERAMKDVCDHPLKELKTLGLNLS